MLEKTYNLLNLEIDGGAVMKMVNMFILVLLHRVILHLRQLQN